MHEFMEVLSDDRWLHSLITAPDRGPISRSAMDRRNSSFDIMRKDV